MNSEGQIFSLPAASRRAARIAMGLSMIAAVGMAAARARANESLDTWYFTAKEIHAAYQYQENFGARIRNPLRAQQCFWGRQDFLAVYRNTEFTVPCRFVTETTRHLKEMLDAGAARYFFPLDANHAHLGVPVAAWEEKYQHLPAEQILPTLLRDSELVALYHTAEHLEIGRDANTEAQRWMEKRNVLGFFDGRPIKILPPNAKGQGVGMPAEYNSYGGFDFLASRAGELFVFFDNKMITFDVSLDPDAFENRGVAKSSGDFPKPIRVTRSTVQRTESVEGR